MSASALVCVGDSSLQKTVSLAVTSLALLSARSPYDE